ncbi:hypothetical protein [Methanosarcina sp. MSH10X1]|uniref:hypothetical protein n=1 Tax=Methanosarcina sp. MSH10X1 TaxID=2507075 RepID=UPI00197C5ADF|nr:hypothetical protein [Methanosarcina sp. MSH10X1]
MRDSTSKLRIATFNLENFDGKTNERPALKEHIPLMQLQLLRLNTDIFCLQEVNGKEAAGFPRRLLALDAPIQETQYAGFHRISTKNGDGTGVYNEHTLVILSRYGILESHQYKHHFTPDTFYKIVTAVAIPGEEPKAERISWKRPIFHARIGVGNRIPDVINLHLKFRMPTDIKGQKFDTYTC